MRSGHRLLAVAGLVVGGLFIAGAVHLFVLRFSRGDIFPPYSSLRSDPLGCKALYESIAGLAGFAVSRSYDPLVRLPRDGSTTLFLVGVSHRDLENGGLAPWFARAQPAGTASALEAFVMAGGRLVVGFVPVHDSNPADDTAAVGTDDAGETVAGADDTVDTDYVRALARAEALRRQWRQRWGVRFRSLLPEHGAAGALDSGYREYGFADTVSLHTALYFADLDPAWHSIYRRDTMPVVIERQMGRGTVVFTAPLFYLSNEGLTVARHTALLAHLVGPHRRVVFNEWCHGLQQEQGVVSLMQKYQLRWVIIVTVVLMGLLIWRRLVGLVPPDTDDVDGDEYVARGKDSSGGLLNLLRRNIPRRDLLRVCVAEWRRAFRHDVRQKQKLPEIEEQVTVANEQKRYDVTACYNALREIIIRRR